jgi:hypothetical protein
LIVEPLGALVSSVGLPAAIVVYLLWTKRKDDDARQVRIAELEKNAMVHAVRIEQILESNEKIVKALLKVFRVKVRRVPDHGTCLEVDLDAINEAPLPKCVRVPATPLPVTPESLQAVFDEDDAKISARVLIPTKKDPSEETTVKLYRRPATPKTPVATERP